jgi:hypothetical protein
VEVDKILAGMGAKTTGVLAANFLTGHVDREAVAAAAARVRIIDFFWADPDPPLVELAHRAMAAPPQGSSAQGGRKRAAPRGWVRFRGNVPRNCVKRFRGNAGVGTTAGVTEPISTAP